MNRLILLIIISLQFLLGFGQHKGNIRVYTKPAKSIIRIDSISAEYGKFIELDTGAHRIKAWAPKRELIVKDVALKDRAMTTVPIRLPYTRAYKRYKRRTRQQNFAKQALRYSFIIGFIVVADQGIKNIKEYSKDADEFKAESEFYREKYEQSFWAKDINFNKIRFNQSRLNYDEAIEEINRNRIIIQAAAGTTILATYFSWRLSNRLKKPEFTEIPKLASLSFRPILLPNSSGFFIKYQF